MTRLIKTAMSALAALLVVIVSAAVPALARDVTEEEQALLEETVASFDQGMRDMDMARVTATIPTKMLEAMAAQYSMTAADLTTAMVEQMTEAMKTVTLVSFGMDLENAEYLELSDGTPYVLIPTETVMDAGNGKIAAKSDTLALLDDGVWYLLRPDESMLPTLRQVYPLFSEVEFTPGTMEAVTE